MARSKADQQARVSANEASRRKEVALALLREIEVQQKLGELVPRDAMERTWVKICGLLRESVLRIPSKCAPAVAAAQDAQECKAILQAECEAVLKALGNELQHTTGKSVN